LEELSFIEKVMPPRFREGKTIDIEILQYDTES
jgi:hypothetical protein